MNPELKAYVEAITETPMDVQHKYRLRPNRRTEPVAAAKTNFFKWAGEILEEFGPYGCQLRVRARVGQNSAEGLRNRCSSNQCSSKPDPIGYHGLI
jgi:hypothetical protein